MKNWKLNSAIFVVAYLIFVLVQMPASMIVGMVTLPNNIKLGTVSGSLWSGKVTAVQYDNELIENATWSLSPLPLLWGSLSADVNFGSAGKRETISGDGHIVTGFSFSSVSLSDFTLRVPASQVMDRLKFPLPVGVEGQMVMRFEEFDQGEPYCETLVGVVDWRRAKLDFGSEKADLKQIQADLACNKGELELKVSKKNPLGLQVTATAGANNKFSAKGFLKPDGTMSDNVHSVVSATFKADGQGRFPFKF